jgi:hypothetical protein
MRLVKKFMSELSAASSSEHGSGPGAWNSAQSSTLRAWTSGSAASPCQSVGKCVAMAMMSSSGSNENGAKPGIGGAMRLVKKFMSALILASKGGYR